jgi:hypothetical protein
MRARRKEDSMISDVLTEAITAMDDYLAEPVYAEVYAGDLRERILQCRDHMDAIRGALEREP